MREVQGHQIQASGIRQDFLGQVASMRRSLALERQKVYRAEGTAFARIWGREKDQGELNQVNSGWRVVIK